MAVIQGCSKSRRGGKFLLIAFILSCVLQSHFSRAGFSNCNCTLSTTTFSGASTSSSSGLTLSPEDEMVNGTNVGKLIGVGGLVLLVDNSGFVDNSPTNVLIHSCPTGFFPISKSELEALIAREDAATLFGAGYLNLKQGYFYFTSTKVKMDVSDSTDPLYFNFYALNYDSTKANVIYSESTKTAWYEYRNAICKYVPNHAPISFTGYGGYDLDPGQKYEMTITNTNIQNYFIETSTGGSFTTKTFQYTHSPTNTERCVNISVRLQMFSGDIVGNCLTFWTKSHSKYGFKSTSDIAADSITKTAITGVNVRATLRMFFMPASASIAPIEGDDSSFLVFYSDKTDTNLYVQKINKNSAKVGSRIPLNESGFAFDIITWENGFFAMGGSEDPGKSWVASYTYAGALNWKRILTNYGLNPTQTDISQMIFFEDSDCKPFFGLAMTFKPHNGRLLYARGRLQIVFAHFNHFGYYDNGSRNDHTGDTMINLCAETGFKQKIHFNWGSSHSLTQQLYYDGKNTLESTLGDAYPQGITFHTCQPDWNFECKVDQKIAGVIPGTGTGYSSGRLGGFIRVADNRKDVFFVYQHKACTSTFGGETTTSTVSEVALMRFMKDLTLVSSVAFFTGKDAKRVNTIRAIAYGVNILVGYNMVALDKIQGFNEQSITLDTDTSHFLLLDTSGAIIKGPFDVSYFIASSDDWEVLENGAVVFSYADPTTGELSIGSFPSLTAVPQPTLATLSDLEYGFAEFTHFTPVPTRNNYNDKCCQSNDPNYSVFELQPLANSTSTSGSTNGNGNTNSTTTQKTYTTEIISANILNIFISLIISFLLFV